MNSTLHPDIVSSIHSSCDIFSQRIIVSLRLGGLPPLIRLLSPCVPLFALSRKLVTILGALLDLLAGM